jgi:hypothetical protein
MMHGSTNINVSDKRRKKIKTHMFCLMKFYFRESCRLWDRKEKYWRGRQAGRPRTKIWRMSIVCWITKSTNTYSEYVTLIAFLHCKNGCTNVTQFYVYT